MRLLTPDIPLPPQTGKNVKRGEVRRAMAGISLVTHQDVGEGAEFGETETRFRLASAETTHARRRGIVAADPGICDPEAEEAAHQNRLEPARFP